ncbi:hypothetical protein CVT24_005793 [Panaeolus cyanescens]|uniref:Thioredoxin-like fold domain-containing protein n=1 Tax=Panaeolus cyanescens TaxID=181874 RepID=A0A409V936_9AGAR|nr:hypothetical protein CVT24_005793 [Panaeolus cyanescens]
MSLQPYMKAQFITGGTDSPHTLDIFLDYVCPYSAKMAFKIENILKPLLGPGGQHAGKVKLVFRLHPQPWHATSTYVHEAALAALRVSPENFWTFSLALFKHQEQFFDIPTQDLSARQIREKLAELAATVLPADTIPAFKDLLAFKGPGLNSGNGVTDDLKYNIKFARQNSIHVSPTVLWDGLVAAEVSSGWEEKDWIDFFVKRL